MLNNFKYGNIMDIKDVKAGDEVICIDDSQACGFLVKDGIYVIKEISKSGDIVINGSIVRWWSERFKLANSINMEEFQIW